MAKRSRRMKGKATGNPRGARPREFGLRHRSLRSRGVDDAQIVPSWLTTTPGSSRDTGVVALAGALIEGQRQRHSPAQQAR